MRKIIALILGLTLLPVFSFSSDVLIPASSRYVVLGRSLTWAGNGFGAVNNNFIFSPQDPDQGLCVFVVNNDVGGHTYTATVQQTGDPNAVSPSAAPARWSNVTVFGNPGTVGAGAQVAFFARSQAAARISVNFSNGAGAGTADLFAVQTSSISGCATAALAVQGAETVAVTSTTNPVQLGGVDSSGLVKRFGAGTGVSLNPNTLGFPLAGNQSAFNTGITSSGNSIFHIGCDTCGINGIATLQTFGQRLVNQAWFAPDTFSGQERMIVDGSINSTAAWNVQNTVAAPAANADLLHLVTTGTPGSTRADPYQAIIDCSSTCEVQVWFITTAGTTCTNDTPRLMTPSSNPANTFWTQIAFGCTGLPTKSGSMLYDLTLNATTPYTLDLSGIEFQINAGVGIMFQEGTASTGSVSITMTWTQN